MTALPAALTAALIEAIVAENLARSAANATEPYIHEVYKAHEDRIDRLVEALADGDRDLRYKFNEALFDITHDGVAWAAKTFAAIEAEVIADRCTCDAYYHPSVIEGEYVHSESCPLY